VVGVEEIDAILTAAARLFPCSRAHRLTPAQLLQTLWALAPGVVEAGVAALDEVAATAPAALDLGKRRDPSRPPAARPAFSREVRRVAEVAAAVDGRAYTPVVRLLGALVAEGHLLPGGRRPAQGVRSGFWSAVGCGVGVDGATEDEEDLVADAAEGVLSPVVPRDGVTDRLLARLCRLEGRVVALVGPEGVGRSSVVADLAWRVAQGAVAWPVRRLRPVRPAASVEADPVRLRKQIAAWLEGGPGLTLPVLREHAVAVLLREDAATLARLILDRDATRNPLLLLVSEGFLRQLDAPCREAVARLEVEEPERGFVERVVDLGAATLEGARQVRIGAAARAAAIDLADRFLRHGFQPAKSLALLDSAVGQTVAQGGGAREVRPEAVREVLAAQTGLPSARLDPARRHLPDLEAELARRVVGQGEAIARVARVLRVVKAGYDSDPRRPDGVFLFTGPSGIGKTELAEALAEALFGRRWRRHLLWKHMSEYSEPNAVAKLCSAPPGYVGHLETRTLVDEIRERPASLLLLDEMDKAHPDVHRLFLQVFDEGVLTDQRGRTAYFGEVTVVMTANLFDDGKGCVGYVEPEPVVEGDERDREMQALASVFPAEFLGRLAEVIRFRRLERADLEEILRRRMIPELQARLEREDGIRLAVDDAVVSWLAEHGGSRRFGARHLDRALQDHVTAPLVAALHTRDARGHQRVRATMGKGGPRLVWSRRG